MNVKLSERHVCMCVCVGGIDVVPLLQGQGTQGRAEKSVEEKGSMWQLQDDTSTIKD